MTVEFRRVGRTCAWTALRPPRTRVPGPSMAAGGDVPHDLATFVIEDALGLEYGFWGCLAAGATFTSLGQKRTPKGRAVIDDHRAELDDAEQRVNDIHFGWRDGRTTAVDRELDDMLRRWRALDDEGVGAIVLEWPVPAARRPRRGGQLSR